MPRQRFDPFVSGPAVYVVSPAASSGSSSAPPGMSPQRSGRSSHRQRALASRRDPDRDRERRHNDGYKAETHGIDVLSIPEQYRIRHEQPASARPVLAESARDRLGICLTIMVAYEYASGNLPLARPTSPRVSRIHRRYTHQGEHVFLSLRDLLVSRSPQVLLEPREKKGSGIQTQCRLLLRFG